jgi:hypothetical protein
VRLVSGFVVTELWVRRGLMASSYWPFKLDKLLTLELNRQTEILRLCIDD